MTKDQTQATKAPAPVTLAAKPASSQLPADSILFARTLLSNMRVPA